MVELQRFNGGKKENGMISQGQGKERQLSGAKCDTQRDKQPLNQQEPQVQILEFKVFMLFVCVTGFKLAQGFSTFSVLEPKYKNLCHSGTQA